MADCVGELEEAVEILKKAAVLLTHLRFENEEMRLALQKIVALEYDHDQMTDIANNVLRNLGKPR